MVAPAASISRHSLICSNALIAFFAASLGFWNTSQKKTRVVAGTWRILFCKKVEGVSGWCPLVGPFLLVVGAVLADVVDTEQLDAPTAMYSLGP